VHRPARFFCHESDKNRARGAELDMTTCRTHEPTAGTSPAGSRVPAGDTRRADAEDPGGLVERAQRGDPEAFRALYRDIQPRLLRYLHALAGQDAEDVAAETWLQITRDLPGFSGDYDHFRGWAATIARHRALDHLRRAARRPPQVAVPAEDLAGWPAADDTAQHALDAVATDAALALIATLPPDQAEAVLLRAVLGLDAQTAGQILGKRAGAVRTAAHRGLRTLARHPALTGDTRTRGTPSR
jgi:RNA polymerase sigma-70 factor (ECF subfamily)